MNRINDYLESLTYFSEYQFLEESKNKQELQEIAKKWGIKIPSHDLAIFKCIYAYVDKPNKNGCILPREEVEVALPSLRGKPIDFDHIRQKTVGYWLDAKIENDKIIAYGIFFKSSLAQDYEIIKELLEKNNLKISFEAYGERAFKEDKQGIYDLRDICFAGGALLINSKPAFPGAQVTEMAKTRVLELARELTAPKSFIRSQEAVEEVEPAKLIKTVVEEKIIRTHYLKPEKFEEKALRITTNYYSNGKKDIRTEEIDVKELFQAQQKFTCECINCGYTIETTEHCKNLRCVKCGGQMRRKERPGPGQASILVLTDSDEKYLTEEELRKWAELSEKEIQDISALPKEVTTCVRKKVKEENLSPVDAVKECWREYKKDKNKEKSSDDDKDDLEKIVEDINKELESRK